MPRGIVVIESKITNHKYCLSFGSSHYNISKGADHNFPKELLRRFSIEKINNAGLTNPGSENYKNIKIAIRSQLNKDQPGFTRFRAHAHEK